MRFIDLRGQPFEMPDPKVQATQELLGTVYDELEVAVDLIEAVYQASCGPDHKHDTTNPLRAVLTVAKDTVLTAKAKLHDTIAWVPVGEAEQ